MFRANAFGLPYFGCAYVYPNVASDRRVTQVLVQAEYKTPTEFRDVTQVLVQAEYATPTEFRYVTQVLIMVEYYRPWLFQPAAAQGGGAQII